MLLKILWVHFLEILVLGMILYFIFIILYSKLSSRKRKSNNTLEINNLKSEIKYLKNRPLLNQPIIFKGDIAFNDNSLFLYLDLKEKQEYLNSIHSNYLDKLKYLIERVTQLRDICNMLTINNSLITKENRSIVLSVSSMINYYYKYLKNRESYFLKEYEITSLGLEGEAEVNSELKFLKDITNFYDVQIKDNYNNSVQCDNIIITSKGVFVLEVKNYGSKGSYGIEIDSTGRWIKKIGKIKEVINSPTSQNNKHVAVLNNILKDLNIKATGIVVISNTALNVANKSKECILRPSSIYSVISSYPNLLSDNKISQIENIIKSKETQSKKYSILNFEEELNFDLISNIRNIENLLMNIYSQC